MAAQGKVYVSAVREVGDIYSTHQYDVDVVFDIAFNYGGYNAGGASYSITCDGQTQSGTATFNIISGGGNYVWGNISTKTFRITLSSSNTNKTIGLSATINTGVNPATISASDSYTLTGVTWDFILTFNANGGSLPNPGGNLYNSVNPYNSVTVSYGTGSYWTMTGDIPTKLGYTFNGWYTSVSGGTKIYDLSGNAVIGTAYWNQNKEWIYKGNLTVYAQWTANTYTNYIHHWMNGFKNGEGNNSNKASFHLTDTSFTASYSSSFSMSSSRRTTVPNGCELENTFGTSSVTNSWQSYNIGASITQVAGGMSFEYYYNPISYNITYNLNGGKNNSSNPSSYNVLYGVTLSNPTRTGYGFSGWYNGSTKITGINQGANASFSSASDLYSKLSSRTTGNVTLTAQWTANTYTVVYHGNGGTWNNTDSWSNTATYGSKYTVEPNFFVRAGYTFVGWTTNSNGTDDGYNWTDWNDNWTYVNGQYGISNGQLNLYAIWEPANVAYVKYNNEYKLCYVYYKENGIWKPVVIYIKSNDSWRRSIV